MIVSKALLYTLPMFAICVCLNCIPLADTQLVGQEVAFVNRAGECHGILCRNGQQLAKSFGNQGTSSMTSLLVDVV